MNFAILFKHFLEYFNHFFLAFQKLEEKCAKEGKKFLKHTHVFVYKCKMNWQTICSPKSTVYFLFILLYLCFFNKTVS